MSVEKLSAATKSSTWLGQAVQLLAIVLIVFLAKGAIAEPFYVPSGSMEPTLLIGDALLASKYPYGYSTASLPMQLNLPETGRLFEEPPKRGDVVVFRWPGDTLAGLGEARGRVCPAIASRCARASSSSTTIRHR